MKYLLFLTLFIPVIVFAQADKAAFTIKGQALDSLTKETLPYVTCSVVSDKNPKLVLSRFAGDATGNFSGTIKSPGTYQIIVSCVGQEPVTKKFTVSEETKEINLGNIIFSPSKQALKELDVVAVKPLIKAEADKITYDIELDPESKSSNVLDMLRKVPMVTVDGQDNIQLQGSTNFKFFLNGKPTNMFSNNPGMILKSFPANMVKNIEVITQPGAKYDAEGIGGIINIVTIQKSGAEGYSATINAQASSRGSLSSGLNLMLQKGKFSFSGNYSYNFNKQFPVITTTERENFIPGALYRKGEQVATVNTTTPMQFGSGQLTYEFDSVNLVTVSYNRKFGRPETTTEAETKNFNASDVNIFSYNQNSIQKQSWGSTDLGIDYQHTFKNKAEILTLSYKLSNTPNSSDFEATNVLNPTYIAFPQRGLAQWSKSINEASTNEHTFQADYTKPIKENQTFETGLKFIKRLNSSDIEESFSFFNFNNTYPFSPFIDFDTISNFDNNQDILGAYASYNGNFDKWSFKGGLRYEHTWLAARFNEAIKNFDDDYGVITPSAIITYRIKPMESFKLGYNKRIIRPGIGFLNPYVDRKDPNYISYGNPDLEPENSHTVNLGFSSFSAKYNLSADLSYNFINNAIEQYSFIPVLSNIQEITYKNTGQKNQVGLNVFGSYRGLKWLNVYINSNVNYVTLKSTSLGLSNEGFTGRLFVGGTVMLPKDMRISTGAGGSLPQINLQGSQSSFYFSYMAITKEFFKKRLSLSLSGVYLPKSHIILTTTGQNGANNTPTFKQTTDVFLTSNSEFRFNISYRLGSMNTQVKKTSSTIENDDQKEKSNSSIGESPM